ncbi:alpha/beta-hydrolase [Aureobasidium pullulans]|nr:alpha/beta-hydrolase [Aureobasidium pullulans]
MSSLFDRVLYTTVGLASLAVRTLLGYFEDDAEHRWDGEYRDDNEVESCFLELENGVRIHYRRPRKDVSVPKLVIFVHGFPDSCHLWTRYLNSDLNSQAQLVALDLPGFGESDNLPSYGPDDVLTTIHLTILALKKKYGSTHCTVVAHDWGGIITSRIAAQTEGLIDHLILVNSLFVPHFGHMINQRIERAGQLISAGPKGGFYKSWLASIKEEAGPVASQLYRSHYIFMFQLPFFSAKRFPSAMRSLLGACRRWAEAEKRHDLSQHDGVFGLAGRQQKMTADSWHGRVALYRESLMSGPWTSAPPTSNGGILDDKTIKCTTTVIFGLGDQALDSRIAVEGIESFVQPPEGHAKGHAYMLEGVGHWSPLNARCHEVVRKVLETDLSGRLTGAGSPPAMGTLCDFPGLTEKKLTRGMSQHQGAITATTGTFNITSVLESGQSSLLLQVSSGECDEFMFTSLFEYSFFNWTFPIHHAVTLASIRPPTGDSSQRSRRQLMRDRFHHGTSLRRYCSFCQWYADVPR